MIVIFLFVIIQFISLRLIGRRLLKDKRCAKHRTTAFPCQKSDKICQFGRIACEELTKQAATQTRTVHCFRKTSSDESRDHKQGSLRFLIRKRAFPGKETGVSRQGNKRFQARKPMVSTKETRDRMPDRRQQESRLQRKTLFLGRRLYTLLYICHSLTSTNTSSPVAL